MTIDISFAHTIAGYFSDSVSVIRPLGNGLINDTFLVTTADAIKFVLQRVNRQVFPEPELITANLLVLENHIRKRPAAQLKWPDILPTATGESHYQDGFGDIWRAQRFIADTESLESLRSLDDALQVGHALGHFHRQMSDVDAACLYDTLPGFHITPDYVGHYLAIRQGQTAVTADPFCDGFIDAFLPYTEILERAKQQGSLRLRVIHGDPKLNNFLFAAHNGSKIVSLIDLDTVKPGLVHYDIGDCLRSCCHDPQANTFDLGIAEAILKGYLGEAGAFFSDADYDYLYPAIQLLPFELGLRFYNDYLQGDRYFKVTEPLQNLHRAKAQFALCQSVAAQREAIMALLQRLRGG